ncbi:hypothetical protein BGZ65_011906, partial [Modicella reniformis]
HSSAWPTITRSEHILNLRHDILPRSAPYALHHDQPLAKRSAEQKLSARPNIISRDDTIRLQFSAFNTTFHLYLEPNTELIHPDVDLGPDLSHEDIKAFKGVVIQDEHYSDHKWKRASTTSWIAKRTVEHMLYEQGVVGWARMMIEHDDDSAKGLVLRGAFKVNDDTYHITCQQHYHIQKRSEDATPASTSLGSNLIIYRDSDLYKPPVGLARKKRGLQTDDVTCGADNMLNKTAAYISSHDYYYPPDRIASIPVMGGFEIGSSWTDVLKAPLTKRQVSVAVAGPSPVPEGCPINRLVNYMGVAADCAYVRSYGGLAQARKQIFADFNTASGIYESTFNIALGVIALNITSENCPATPVEGMKWNQDCSTSYTIDQRLSDFSFWRGEGSRAEDGAGLWHLMTKCNSGAVVGIAWTKALCQMSTNTQTQGGSIQYTAGTGVSSITPNEWMVVAHEIGHGFGAIHDCTAQTCSVARDQCCPLDATTCDAGSRYIMNPSEQAATRVFSPCSIKTICTTVASSVGACLKPPGQRETQSGGENICGNGLKESGEECDCGSPEECQMDPCCDGTTCKFKNGAICDDLNDDCCQSCQLRAAGQVCRQAISECDIQEVCSGTSATCPPDIRVDDLTPCKGTNNATGLQCANGACTSRDLQCQQQDREGITKQCSASNTCELMCNDPGGSALSCMQIPSTYFVDGTPCGFGGTCARGECRYTNGIYSVLNWARNHLAIVIPVGCLLGLLLICCIWTCCCSPLIRRRQQKRAIQRRSANRPSRIHTIPNSRTSTGGHPAQAHGANMVQGARHAGQQQQPPMNPAQAPMNPAQPPMSAIYPPSPVHHDPSVLLSAREDQEIKRAIEESRREHEELQRALEKSRREYEEMQRALEESRRDNRSNMQTSAGMNQQVDSSLEVPQSHNGATVVSTPRIENTQPDSPYQTNNTSGINNGSIGNNGNNGGAAVRNRPYNPFDPFSEPAYPQQGYN